MASRISLSRPLLLELMDSATHVLLCAPTGYGKTHLLRAYRDQAGVPLLEATPRMSAASIMEAAQGSGVVLVDQAHLLAEEVVEQLLHLNPAECRVVLALRHTYYRRMGRLVLNHQVTLLGSSELRFSKDEMLRFGVPQSQVHDVMARTLGWPALVVLEMHPLLSSTDFLEELYLDLPPAYQELVATAATLDTWAMQLMLMPDQLRLRGLLNTGFPIIQDGSTLEMHPSVRSFVLHQIGAEVATVVAEQNMILDQLLADKLSPLPSRIAAIQTFFSQGNDDDLHASQKVALLSSIPIEQMPSKLRDDYVYYLVITSDHEKADRVLLYQREFGTPSTRTYVFLGRAASRRNDLVGWKEALRRARELVASDDDEIRCFILSSDLELRLGHLPEALRDAERAYEAASRAGNLELLSFALLTLMYARQMNGNLPGAIRAGQEALQINATQGHKYVRQSSALHSRMADVMKDIGWHEQALAHIQGGLNLQLVTPHPSIPYLYSTRGLIYVELRNYEEALESFSTSLELFEMERNLVGSLIPRAYSTYVLYRMGRFGEIHQHVQAIHDFSKAYSDVDQVELLAYVPLVNGIWHLVQGNDQRALEAFEQVTYEPLATYDSVLITQLFIIQQRSRLGTLTAAQVSRLVSLMDARQTESDFTLAAYAADFKEALTACLNYGIEKERFQRLLDGVNAPVHSLRRPENHIVLQTMGNVSLKVNGQVFRTDSRSHYPVYVFTYLLYCQDWVTAETLGDEFHANNRDRRKSAQQSFTGLRKLLEKADVELTKILSEQRDSRGYCVQPVDNIIIEADFLNYLKKFLPSNPQTDELELMLVQFQPFLPSVGNRFADDMNERLNDQVVEVALHLADVYMAEGNVKRATRVVLLALKHVPDPQLVERYTQLREALESKRSLPHLGDDDDEDLLFGRSVSSAIAMLEYTERDH